MKTFKKIALFFVMPLAVAVLTSSYAVVPILPECPEFDNGQGPVIFPNLEDCSTFYKCDWGTPILMKCPYGLHYNPEFGYCDWPLDDPECIVTTDDPDPDDPNPDDPKLDPTQKDCWNAIEVAVAQKVFYCGTCTWIDNSKPTAAALLKKCTE